MAISPSLRIVSAYRGMARYVEAARSTSRPDLAALWWVHAVEPYWAQWAEGQFNEARTREQLRRPVFDLDGLASAVERLAQSGVEPLVADAYDEITRALPSPLPERVVCIYAADPQNAWVRENGVVGTGIGDNILLQINPLGENWQGAVRYAMAHEYHHAVWGYTYFALQGHTEMDLLTGLLIDGQADSFARTLYPDMSPVWIRALTPEQETVQWERMQEYLAGNDEAVYRRFFFGDAHNGTPGSTAYTIGYHIVQAYLKAHPARTVLDLMDQPARAILAESGYDPSARGTDLHAGDGQDMETR